ncbi:DNA replication/repair protein RecF [Kordiimonas pumila]|uniref:DNA replication and repair protein RecF n=1 Tax=Kordiimonas pumila TaxID=2161677 RepID=A0ABV7D5S6_9PROT|nr:DNA replication/repair protein RecF [Kordiimonas pumila]
MINIKPSAQTFVSKLTLTDFRCYDRVTLPLSCDHTLVVLTGPNGAGKTNLLEAISYLAPGRGLRRAALSDVARKNGAGTWAVAADLLVGTETVKAGTGVMEPGDTTTSKRVVRLDGKTIQNSNTFGERWSVSWLTPQMDRLFIEGPSSRRRFLDRMVLGLFPDHSRQVGAYERVMRERNKLLAQDGRNADSVWLGALEARMAEHGTAIAVARLEFAGQLAGQLATEKKGPFPKAELAIDGWIEGMLAEGAAAVEVEVIFRNHLAKTRGTDLGGRTSGGVHKTDLVVTHAPKGLTADLCSTGEQKALLVALVLANARLQTALRGQAPLMLMDEVAAHLDAERRQALFETLAELGSQCWLTGTDIGLFNGLSGKAEFFNVSDGVIQQADK